MKFSKTLMEKNGWRLMEDNEKGFWVMSTCGLFGGFTTNQKAAEDLLMDRSGAREEGFPAVKEDDVKVVRGNQIPLGIEGKWYRVDTFYLNGKTIGQVQVRSKATPKVITKVKDKACIGYDLKWMLRENGFRLQSVS